MKKTMFVTAMLITILATMLVANFAFAAAPAPIAGGTVTHPVRDDAGKVYVSANPASYIPMTSLASGNTSLYLLDRADRFDSIKN